MHTHMYATLHVFPKGLEPNIVLAIITKLFIILCVVSMKLAHTHTHIDTLLFVKRFEAQQGS